GVLVASRWPAVAPAAPAAAVPWPERLLATGVAVPGWPAALDVVCLHAPLSQSADEAKVRTLEAVHTSLAALGPSVPAILCGDLNTPQYEARDGTVQTFA